MPFGIKNGPTAFARAIFMAMERFIPESMATYIDDLTVSSGSFEEFATSIPPTPRSQFQATRWESNLAT